MESFDLCLMLRHKIQLRTLPHALPLRCYIIVPIDKSVDPITQEESLFLESEETAVLVRYREGLETSHSTEELGEATMKHSQS